VNTPWRRVNREHPCPVCGKPDWCLVAPDETAVICPRTLSPKRCGDAGWLHRLADTGPDWLYPFTRRISLVPPSHDFTVLAERFRAAADPIRFSALAHSLGVSAVALAAFGVGWSETHRAWSFPLTDPVSGRVTGIRLRRPSRFKFAVTGSKGGLFLPDTRDPTDRRLLITEGPTDAAALLDLGFPNVAGRPSCAGGTRHVAELVKLRRPAEVVVLADSDEPGRRGADTLASVLAVCAPAVRVVAPPDGVKDARAWKLAGATHADFERLISSTPARRLTVRAAVGKGR
jgi:hypothetical protein